MHRQLLLINGLKKSITIHKKMDFYDVNSDLEDKLYQAKKVLRELGGSIEEVDTLIPCSFDTLGG